AAADRKKTPALASLPSMQNVWAREEAIQSDSLRDIFGNAFQRFKSKPGWLTSNVISLVIGIYTDGTFDRLPIVADALEESGCTDAEILSHCRSEGPHVRGCWVVDLILGKE